MRKTWWNRGGHAGWLFVLPALAVIIGFTFYPMVQAMVLSLYRWNLLGSKTYVGLDNYQAVLSTGTFRLSLTNTVIFTVGTLAGTYLLALGTALLVNRELKVVGLARAVTVLPAIIPMVVAGLIWKWLYEPQDGLINTSLAVFGVEGAAWLFDSSLALPAIMAVSIWKEFGVYALVLLGGLQRIPVELYEAADIDRAGQWQKFRSITMPLLRPATAVVILLLIFSSFKVFDQVWVMTGGGPGNATLTVVTFIYSQLLTNVGIAAAASVILFLILLVLTAVRLRTSARNELT